MIIEPWAKREMNIVVLGDTVTGKTALVNLIANMCAGFTLKDFEDKIELSNEAGNNGGSKTIQPHLYSITCVNGHKVNILDTPGLADRRGMDKEMEHLKAIIDAMKKNFDTIDGIVVLQSGLSYHLGPTVDSTLLRISYMFPGNIYDNIALVLTFVGPPKKADMITELLPEKLQKAPQWSINNPLALWFTYQKKLAEGWSDEEHPLEELHEMTQHEYKRTTEMLSQLFQYLDKCKTQPVKSRREDGAKEGEGERN
ncbi:hypothetical protein C8R41DRAFT_557557 [Lentinula lateritia]|uniref:AIG1-type G domain-containing protein n=1 Tax=Lentinula lateritia TaxID=40482 RepID=A0ABQ8V4P7_9AGAR|nr:hypothetical protein C8R41DRAFT_557557 [Lentinula lateritia]